MVEEEIFRPINSPYQIEGMYEVSNLGRVKSLPNYTNFKEKILKGFKLGKENNAYLLVDLRRNGV